jgi:ATP-dependent protease ClpP protease subunit
MMELWVPEDIRGEVADDLAAQVRVMPPGPLAVHVNCNNGSASCWDLAEAIGAHKGKTTAIIGAEAKSAGLIVACACDHRACRQDTQFLYHGFAGQETANRKKAVWFAARTTKPEAEWYAMAEDGELHEFGADEALSYGVVHEVSP